MFRVNRSFRRIASLAVLAAAWAAPALGGSFSVNPVRIELTSIRPNALVEISNLSDKSTTVQVHVVSWRSDNNQNVFLLTDDVLVNPPIFTVGPRQKQFMRLGLRRPINASGEVAYRLILEEVPKPPAPGFVGLRTVLRISIPIFVKPGAVASPKLVWHADYINRDSVRLTASNQGNAHIQISELELTPMGVNATSTKKPVWDYLLPSQARAWIIDRERIGEAAKLILTAHTDAGKINEAIVQNGR